MGEILFALLLVLLLLSFDDLAVVEDLGVLSSVCLEDLLL